MRLRSIMLMAAVVVPAMTALSAPASALKICKCIDRLPSGYCSGWGDCHEVDMFAHQGGYSPIKSTRDCRKSQMLQCDNDTCKIVCGPSGK